MKFFLFTLVFLVLTLTYIEGMIRCMENTCDTLRCANASEETCNKPNQRLQKGGFCNCCTVCYTTLGENEQCPNTRLIGGPPPTSGCGKGLECKDGRCVKSGN